MKAVMMSIQPKWCELIASGKKTVEVRKTKPKIAPPFKCYIYCTADRRKHICDTFVPQTPLFVKNGLAKSSIGREDGLQWKLGNGQVIGEFVCDRISGGSGEYAVYHTEGTCLTSTEIADYIGDKYAYYWHITDLVIYDEPRELGEFKTFCNSYYDGKHCDECKYFVDGRCYEYDESDCGCHGLKPITRPPQSWCYCEEVTE